MNDSFNDQEIQSLRKIELEYDEEIEACVDHLAKELDLSPAPCPAIESFLLYKSLRSPAVVETYKSSTGNFTIAVYQIQYAWIAQTKYSGYRNNQCFYALLFLDREYPATCIFKETLQARINDWFTKQDVDFEDQKEFSRKFTVVSNDKSRLQSRLLGKPLHELLAFPEMEAEIRGKYCFFKVSGDSGSEYYAERLVELAKKLYSILR